MLNQRVMYMAITWVEVERTYVWRLAPYTCGYVKSDERNFGAVSIYGAIDSIVDRRLNNDKGVVFKIDKFDSFSISRGYKLITHQ